jgi:hypothetical protein
VGQKLRRYWQAINARAIFRDNRIVAYDVNLFPA